MSHIKSATLLDNFYTSTKNWEDGPTGILKTDESLGLDHKAIFTITKNVSIPKLPEYRVQRDLCAKSIYKLNECYKNKDWNELYALETARDSCSFFILFVNNMFLICCPEKFVEITYHNRNPWINKSLTQDKAEREKLLKIKIKDQSEEIVSMYKRCTVGAKEIFTPYKSREHIYKSNVQSDLLQELIFCHVAFDFYNIMQYIWHGFYEFRKIFCIYRDPQLHQDFL